MNALFSAIADAGAKLNPPALERDILSLEKSRGFSLPPGVREIYMEANGADGSFGEWIWNFLPITSPELTVSEYYGFKGICDIASRRIDLSGYLRIFDVLIDAPVYAYCAEPKSKWHGEVIGVHGDNRKFDAFVAASSFKRFAEILVNTRFDEAIVVDGKMA